ncbi:uncharacterized protein isoform X2 [Rhodnius prolixus]|uniref:uncharacterized protein isoform X2 n=1 Tax=Rhodnius prolixus TaxID=13249 RepID=UPI003D18D1D8
MKPIFPISRMFLLKLALLYPLGVVAVSVKVKVVAIPVEKRELPRYYLMAYKEKSRVIKLKLPEDPKKDAMSKRSECFFYTCSNKGIFTVVTCDLCIKWSRIIDENKKVTICYNLWSTDLQYSHYKCLKSEPSVLSGLSVSEQSVKWLEEMTCLVETLNTFRCFAYNYKDRTIYVYGYINPVGGTTSYVGVYATKVLDSFAKIYLLESSETEFNVSQCDNSEKYKKVCLKVKEKRLKNGDTVGCFKMTAESVSFTGTKCFRRNKKSYKFWPLKGNIQMLDGW